jgi:hypothetical protein
MKIISDVYILRPHHLMDCSMLLAPSAVSGYLAGVISDKNQKPKTYEATNANGQKLKPR